MPIVLSGFNKVHVNIVHPLITTKATEFGDYRVYCVCFFFQLKNASLDFVDLNLNLSIKDIF